MGNKLDLSAAKKNREAKPVFVSGKVPITPLGKIALSLSGGGYRAATFHLGGMSYLNYLDYNGSPLLENVEMISTVSGGTILGVVYTMRKQKGESFIDIYRFLLKKLETVDLISTGIKKLNPDQQLKNPKKAKNLINAFAEQYDEHFTQGATLGDLTAMNSHLKAVVFNATEFSSAINFRFRNPDFGLSGNNSFRVSKQASSEIKLSDVLASSSCFPGGFEPLLWPNDYCHEKSPLLDKLCLKNKKMQKPPAGIMDGGIYDNQGVESILIHKNGLNKPYFDLIIISDVASPDMKAYKPLEETPKKNDWKSLTIRELITKAKEISSHIYCTLGLIAALGALIPYICGFNNSFWNGVCFALSAVSLLLITAKWFALWFAKCKFNELGQFAKGQFPDFYYQQLSKLNIQELSVHRIQPLLFNRVNSLTTLLGEVFLKIIRRLNYKRLYEHPNYQFRRLTTLIKELTEGDWKSKHKKKSYIKEIGPDIKGIAEQAASFGTTLWFTDQEKLDELLPKLVITGQVTMCYNMKIYLEELIAPAKKDGKDNGYSDLKPEIRAAIEKTLKTCREDWEKFKKNPDYLFNSLK